MKDKEKANVPNKEQVETRNKIGKEKSELKQALLHYANAEASGGIKSLIDCEGCAFYLYENLGYRKLPKDSVVLTKEEYEDLLARPLNAMGDLVSSKIKSKNKCKYNKDDICVNADSEYLADYCPIKEEVEKARKETAEKIFRDVYTEILPYIYENGYLINKFNELAKQFGVEIKE